SDGAGLIGDGTGDRLADPPGRVRRKFVPASPFKFIDSLHQTDVAFLNQVKELQTAVRVFLGNRNNEPQVGFDKLAFSLVGVELTDTDRLIRTLDLNGGKVILLLDDGQRGTRVGDLCV